MKEPKRGEPVLITEKKEEEKKLDLTDMVEEVQEEGVAELVIDLRKMLQEYDIIRVVLPETPGEQVTTENGTELVFFQEETAT